MATDACDFASLDAILTTLPPATDSEGPDFARVRDEVRKQQPAAK
jgi:hypothetical protein